MRNICTIGDCDRFVQARGFCVKHYERFRTTGDPTATKKRATDVDLGQWFDEQLSAPTAAGCREWMRSRLPDTGRTKPYGRVCVDGRLFLAHRVAYELAHGPIPEGLIIMHTCDNPPCCEQSHLVLGTHADNSADMAAKGRQRGGRTP